MKFLHHIIVLCYLLAIPVLAQSGDEESGKSDTEGSILIKPSIFDERKILTAKQISRIKAAQKEEFEEITLTQELLLPSVNFQQAFLIAQRMG